MIPATVAMIVLAAVLIAAAISDVRTQAVPNWLTFPAMATGLLLWFLAGWMENGHLYEGFQRGGQALLVMCGGLGAFLILYVAGGVGGGDVKVMGTVGALSASWTCLWNTAFYGILIAALLGVVVMIRRGLVRQTLRRILTAAMTAAARVKPELPDDSPKIPLVAGMAVAGCVAGASELLKLDLPLM